MKIVYIAHPIGGDIESNLKDLRRIIRKINLTFPDVVPFTPYYADVVSMDDNNPPERSRGISNDTEILRRGIPDEMWLTGSKISAGMQAEADMAKSMNMPVIDKTNKL